MSLNPGTIRAHGHAARRSAEQPRASLNSSSSYHVRARDLSAHGVRCLDDDAVGARRQHTGEIVLLSLEAAASMEVVLNTSVAHPYHAAFVFVLAKGFESGVGGRASRPVVMKSNLMIGPSGANTTLRFDGRWKLILALVPRSPLTRLAPSLPTSARVFTDRRLADRALQQFLEMLLKESAEVTSTEGDALEPVVSEMCAAVLRDRGTPVGEDSRRDRLRGRALAFIAEHCSDPELSPARVAREANSSLRQLQAVFAEAGEGVAEAIRRERAHLARLQLIDYRYDTVSVEQIARSSGFSSSMSLRRALATAYGTTPRALRQRQPARKLDDFPPTPGAS